MVQNMTRKTNSLGHPADPEVVAPSNSALIRHFLISAVGNLVLPLATLLTAPILARSLGVEGRGELAGAVAPFMLATAIATIGIPDALTFFVARSSEVRAKLLHRAFLILLLSGTLATVFVAAFASYLSEVQTNVSSLMLVSCISIIPTLGVAALRGAASGNHEWTRVTSERIISAAIRIIALVILAFTSSLNPLTGVIVMTASPVIGGLAYLKRRNRDESTKPPGARIGYKFILQYGSKVWVGSVSGILLSRIDQVLLTPLAGVEELGIYAVAVNISEVPLILSAAITAVLFTADARSNNNDLVGRAARIGGLLAITAALAVGLPMSFWVPWLFGEEFASAVFPAALLLAAVALGTPGSQAGAVLSARGTPELRSYSLLIACAVNIALVLLLAREYGAVGAATATVAGNLLASLLNIVFLRVRHGVPMRHFFGIRLADWAVIGSNVRRVLRLERK